MMDIRRPSASLIVALLLWIPSARSLIGGDLDLNGAAIRLLVALGVAWTGLTLLAWLTAGYGRSRHLPEPRPAERRRTDLSEAED